MDTNSREIINGTRQTKINTKSGRSFGQDITNNAISKPKFMGINHPNTNGRGHVKIIPHRRSKPSAKQQPNGHRSLQPSYPVGNRKYTSNESIASTVQIKEKQSFAGKSSSIVRVKNETDDIDLRDKEDPLCATDYVEDMYFYFRQMEKVTEHYSSSQTGISSGYRMILVDWLLNLHDKLLLCDETIYLAVTILDRYLSNETVALKELQLVGLTSLFIASKYEEIYYPTINEFIAAGGAPFVREHVLDMETKILKSLNYQISMPTLYTFLLRFTRAAHANKTMVQMTLYLAEGCLLSYDLLRCYKPSELVSASVYLARSHVPGRSSWTATLTKYTGYTAEDLVPIAGAILSAKYGRSRLMRKKYRLNDVYINKKYSTKNYGQVALVDFRLG